MTGHRRTFSFSGVPQHNGSRPMPPGATGSANSTTDQYAQASLAQVMDAPARLSMPHLHPHKLDGALWFSNDVVCQDIRSIWKSNFWGPWWNFSMVSENKKSAWWTSFVQKYYWHKDHHEAVYKGWKKYCQDSIGSRVSQRKKSGKKPDYISAADWKLMQDAWLTVEMIHICKIASENRCSDQDGTGMHRHAAGAKKFVTVSEEMAAAAGGKQPSITEIVRKTHTRKDGSFVDRRAELLVKAAEELASQTAEAASEEDGDNLSEAVPVSPTNDQLSAAYLQSATSKKGRIYGIGSMQFMHVEPNESAATSFTRNMNTDIRIGRVEDIVATLQETATSNKKALEVLLRINGVNPVTFEPLVAQPPPARSDGSTTDAAAGANTQVPINLAEMSPQEVTGFYEN